MKEFKAADYYTSFEATSKKLKDPEKKLGVTLLPPAKVLIAEYYADKYQTNIKVITDKSYQLNMKEYLADIRSHSKEGRIAFCFGVYGGGHSVPVIYMKEYIGEELHEGILLADSVLSDVRRAKEIKNLTQIDVYTAPSGRQADGMSCHVDALIFGRIATAKTASGEYQVPHLLKSLKERSEPKEGYSETKLTDEFLIAAQPSAYVNENKEEKQRIIHTRKDGAKESLTLFRARYQDELEEGGHLPGYLREKGIKMANMVEIQFYVNQLQEVLGPAWTPELRRQFLLGAKENLKLQGPPKADRKGLFQFAEKFLDQIRLGAEKKERSEVVENEEEVKTSLRPK